MGEWLTYREAAKRVNRSVREINRWRQDGMPMGWGERDGQRVRVVEVRALLTAHREHLNRDPVHRIRMRKLRDTPNTEHPERGVIP